MRKEVRLLLDKALDSLVLAVEQFNRPWDRGRVASVLILMDHSLEMLLKAAIVHRGGRIRDRRANQTIGFDTCVRKALSDGTLQFISEEQALLLQTVNSLRDAAQHHLLDISEPHLYMHAQAGLTLFKDILDGVFNRTLGRYLPNRVLPISTTVSTDLTVMFANETKEIAAILTPDKRRRTEARAKLRALAIVDAAIRGEKVQPSDWRLDKLANEIRKGTAWHQVFPGAAAVTFTATGSGPALDLRISKKEGIPVRLVPEGTEGATVVALKRVNELGFYKFGLTELAKTVGLSGPKANAMIWHLGIRSEEDSYRHLTIGKSHFHRYSQSAADRIRKALESADVQEIWRDYYGEQKATSRRQLPPRLALHGRRLGRR